MLDKSKVSVNLRMFLHEPSADIIKSLWPCLVLFGSVWFCLALQDKPNVQPTPLNGADPVLSPSNTHRPGVFLELINGSMNEPSGRIVPALSVRLNFQYVKGCDLRLPRPPAYECCHKHERAARWLRAARCLSLDNTTVTCMSTRRYCQTCQPRSPRGRRL